MLKSWLARLTAAIGLTLVLVSTQAPAAQKTQAVLSAEIQSNFPSCGTSCITAANLRTVFQDVVDSYFNVLATATGNTVLAGPNGSNGAPTYRALVGPDLPLPGASSLGGVKSASATSTNVMLGIDTSGNPAFGAIPAGAVSNSMLANAPAQTLKGNNTTGSAAPTDLTVAQVKTLLAILPVVTDPAYGAKCDGTTDDTAAFTAIAAANPIWALPPNATCVISSAVTLSSTQGMGIVGWGEQSSIIKVNSTSAKGIIVPAFASNPLLYGFSITRVGTAASGATGLDLSGGVNGGRLERIFVEKHFNGIVLGPTDSGGIRDVISQKNQNHGFLFNNSATSGSMQWQLDNCGSYQNAGDGFVVASGVAGPSGITMGEWRSVQTFANTGPGIAFLGSASIPIQGVRLRQAFVGQDNSHEIYFDTYNTGAGPHYVESPYAELAGTSSTGPTLATAATNTGSGIFITANNGPIQVNNPSIFGNSADGISFSATNANGGRLTVSGGQIFNNGAGGASRRGIISLADGSMIVIGVRAGNTGAGTNQLYGVALAVAGSDHNIVIGNDLRGNNTAAILNSSTGANNRIEGNDGWNPVGTTAAANVCTSPCTYTAGPSPETLYFKQTATNTATITQGGQQIAALVNASTYYVVQLGPNESIVTTWATTTPTFTKVVH